MVKEREKKDLPRNHEKIVCLKNQPETHYLSHTVGE